MLNDHVKGNMSATSERFSVSSLLTILKKKKLHHALEDGKKITCQNCKLLIYKRRGRGTLTGGADRILKSIISHTHHFSQGLLSATIQCIF